MDLDNKPDCLLVDDDNADRDRLAIALRDNGNLVTLANSLEEVHTFVHQDNKEIRKFATFGDINQRGCGHSVFLYLKNTSAQRSLAFVWTHYVDTNLRRIAKHLGASYAFDKNIHPIEELVWEANNSTDWERLKLGMRDSMTGLFNRNGFVQLVPFQLALMRHHRSPTEASAVLMIDVNKFKDINDTHGHLVGDEAIMLIAQTLKDSVRRNTDLVARYAGDEVIIWLPGATAWWARRRLGEKIKRNLARLKLRGRHGALVPLEVAVGAADIKPYEVGGDTIVTLTALIARADDAMYEDKGGQGRETAAS